MGGQTLSQAAMAELQALDRHAEMSPELFGVLAPLTPQVAVESVALRQGPNNTIQVYMIRRSLNDLAYPGMIHSPGSILRNGEEYRQVLDRLAAREFGVDITDFQLVDEVFFEEERGWFNNRIILITLGGEPTGGEWYDVDDLPDETIDHHRDLIIPKAVAAFKKQLPATA